MEINLRENDSKRAAVLESRLKYLLTSWGNISELISEEPREACLENPGETGNIFQYAREKKLENIRKIFQENIEVTGGLIVEILKESKEISGELHTRFIRLCRMASTEKRP